MPLMPAPPMPTKWMCLTACFIATTSFSISSATRAAARGRASACAFSAMATSAARSSERNCSASRSGVNSLCGRWIAAPCCAMNVALSRWCEVVLTTSGTSTLGTPAAQSSLMVTAPARQTIRSHCASRAAMSSMNGTISVSCSGSSPASRYSSFTASRFSAPV